MNVRRRLQHRKLLPAAGDAQLLEPPAVGAEVRAVSPLRAKLHGVVVWREVELGNVGAAVEIGADVAVGTLEHAAAEFGAGQRGDEPSLRGRCVAVVLPGIVPRGGGRPGC